MAGRQAKVLTPITVRRALNWAKCSTTPERDKVIILLSVLAGLRACEICRVEWHMVLDARGRVGGLLELPDRAAKKGSGRRIPIHAELRQALVQLKRLGASTGPIVVSKRGGQLRPNSVVNWFVTLFRDLRADGCSSHSGRRTFITQAARSAHRVGATLRDVQILAGHRSLTTTERYIDGDSDAQRRLVSRL